MARARGDLALAKVALPEGGFYEDLCFHAQQAAEKAITAVYRHRGLVFQYTHDLGELLAGLKDHGVELPPMVEEAQVLSSYASEARYLV
ncbi:MAG: HEPN domain-containing protein [Firmicutes bacterium]|nr:HEPN domain-containing protein [Bacillota bacterium]